MFPSGLAAQEGTIQKGDEVLSINGQTLRGVTHADATAALRQARNLKMSVVVISKRAEEDGREGGGCRSEEPNPASESNISTEGLNCSSISRVTVLAKTWFSIHAENKPCGSPCGYHDITTPVNVLSLGSG